MESRQIRILSVDDHPLFRDGIATVIKNQADMELVAEAATGADAQLRYEEHHPDITLMEVNLPDGSGLQAMMAIRARFPEARIILLSTYEGEIELLGALQAGARGHILKTMHPREIVAAIHQVHGGAIFVPPPRTGRGAENSGTASGSLAEIEFLERLPGKIRTRDPNRGPSASREAIGNRLLKMMARLGADDRAHAVALAARRSPIRM